MPENQWEYCMLYITNSTEHKKGAILGIGGVVQGRGYDCGIVYINSSGKEYRNILTKTADILDFNPFYKATGLLGNAGWEMVNFQHGNMAMGVSGGGNDVNSHLHTEWNTISWGNAIAYFKRQVLSNRAVNEPKIIFS